MGLALVCLVAWLVSWSVCLGLGGVGLPPMALSFSSFLGAFTVGSAVVGPMLLIVRERLGGVSAHNAWALPLAGIGIGVVLAAVLLFALRQPLLSAGDFPRTVYAAGGSFGMTFGAGLLIVRPRTSAARHQR